MMSVLSQAVGHDSSKQPSAETEAAAEEADFKRGGWLGSLCCFSSRLEHVERDSVVPGSPCVEPGQEVRCLDPGALPIANSNINKIGGRLGARVSGCTWVEHKQKKKM